jgi:hypothetical protein
MIVPTNAQLQAAVTAAKQEIKVVSPFYSSMISDSVLIPVVNAALTAGLNVKDKP